jgi:hypothetical protein
VAVKARPGALTIANGGSAVDHLFGRIVQAVGRHRHDQRRYKVVRRRAPT